MRAERAGRGGSRGASGTREDAAARGDDAARGSVRRATITKYDGSKIQPKGVVQNSLARATEASVRDAGRFALAHALLRFRLKMTFHTMEHADM